MPVAHTYPLFLRGLYEEHLEEASFLFTQCRALRDNPEVSWPRLADFEARLEAHLDALVVGGEAALVVCRERASAGDAGELFACASVYCRQRRSDLLSESMRTVDFNDPLQVEALAEALAMELPDEWAGFIEQAMARDGRLASLLAPVCERRRLPAEATLIAALPTSSPAESVIASLGRLKARAAVPAIRPYLQGPDVSIKSSALLALARLGDEESVRAHYLVANMELWPRETLALAGDASAEQVFLQLLAAGKADQQTVLALGLLGLGSSLRSLYEILTQQALADSAALAMHWITGAALFDDVFVPQDIPEEEMSASELQAWQSEKKRPLRADGTPYGETVRKLSVDKKAWKRWFSENLQRFNPTLRYRGGVPLGPEALLHTLMNQSSTKQLRDACAAELAIRYGCEINVDTRLPVARQVQSLREVQPWVESIRDRFVPGAWYFDGRPQ